MDRHTVTVDGNYIRYSGMSDEATLVGREPCPECRKNGKDNSGDNLARYLDGHAYCYSCKYREPADIQYRLTHKFNKRMDENLYIRLPRDAQKTNLNHKALQWIGQYGITREEINRYDMRWSDALQLFILPIYGDDDTLLAWQGREFGKSTKKYYSNGPIHHILYPMGLTDEIKDGIIVVEDFVSAMKVGRQRCTIPLFGSIVNSQMVHRLYLLTNHLTFWLDYDKMDEAMNGVKLASQFSLESNVVVTKKDPKEYSDEEIKQTLSEQKA